MSLNLLNSDPLPDSMSEIEEKGYSLQVETSLATHTVRNTVPETNPRTNNEAGTNLVIQENGSQHSLEMNLPNSDPLLNSMTEIEEGGYSSITIRQPRRKYIDSISNCRVRIERSKIQDGQVLVESSVVQIIPEIFNHLRANKNRLGDAEVDRAYPVSYTHLTLPTNREV